MSKVFLHIGLHKTGTSSIQKFLEKNSDLLEERAGIKYFKPDPWPLPFRGNKPEINLCLDGLKELDRIDIDKIVLSHENYSWLFNEDDIRTLVEEIRKYSTTLKVILYLRRQDSLAISQKQEGTKWLDNSVAYGHSEGALPEKINYFSENYLNFYSKVSAWVNALGRENLIIRIFDKDKLLYGDVVKDFFYQLNIDDLSPYRSVGRVNESISRKRQIFLHRTRGVFKEGSPEKKFLVQHILSAHLDDSDKLLPSKQQAYDFYQQFRDSNIKLRKDFLDGECLDIFSEDFSMYPEESNYSELELDEYIDFFHSAVSALVSENQVLKQLTDSDEEVAWLRNYALRAEKVDIKLALDLMSRAYSLKPHGPFIRKKLEEYRERLSDSSNTD